MNILNGGKHSDNNINIQEFMIMPIGSITFTERLKRGVEVYHTLKKVDIFLFTFSTALLTPFPIYLVLSLSLNSIASKLPVDAPDGTIAVPENPPSILLAKKSLMKEQIQI